MPECQATHVSVSEKPQDRPEEASQNRSVTEKLVEAQAEVLSVVVGGRGGEGVCENGILLLLAPELVTTLLFVCFYLTLPLIINGSFFKISTTPFGTCASYCNPACFTGILHPSKPSFRHSSSPFPTLLSQTMMPNGFMLPSCTGLESVLPKFMSFLKPQKLPYLEIGFLQM